MLAQNKTHQSFKTADQYQLFKIRGTWSHLHGVQQLPRSIRPWIHWIAALLKCGYDSIKAPTWAITKAHFESCSRTTGSDRSTRRALKWLEDNDFISRQKLRIGQDCHGLIINFNIEKFQYFLNKKPCVPVSDNSSHRPICPGDNITSNTKPLPDSDCFKTAYKSKDKDKSRQNRDQNNEKKAHRFHPVQHTIFCLLAKHSRRFAICREVTRRIELNDPSDLIDWGAYSRKWQEMTVEERENVANCEILPLLENKSSPSLTGNTSPPNLNMIVHAACQKSVEINRDLSPPTYEYDPAMSRDDNEALEKLHQTVFWARVNQGIC